MRTFMNDSIRDDLTAFPNAIFPEKHPQPDWPTARHSPQKGVGCKRALLQPGLTPQILG